MIIGPDDMEMFANTLGSVERQFAYTVAAAINEKLVEDYRRFIKREQKDVLELSVNIRDLPSIYRSNHIIRDAVLSLLNKLWDITVDIKEGKLIFRKKQ